MAFSAGSSLSACCSVWDLWYFTSVIQKLFFHILTPGFEKMLPQKGFMADVMLWEAPCDFWHSSGTYHFPKCLSTTPKSMRMRSVKCSSWCPMDTDVFEVVALLLCWPFLNVTIDHFKLQIVVDTPWTLTDLWGSFWTGEAGSAGAAPEWMVAEGCGLSGALSVLQWSLCDEAPLHSRSNLQNTQWNHVLCFLQSKNSVWAEADGLKCGWNARGLPASASHVLCLTFSRGIVTQHTLNKIMVQPGWQCGTNH